MRQFIILISIFILASCSPAKKLAPVTVPQVVLSEEQQRDFDFHFYEGLRLKEEGMLADAYDSLLACRRIDSLDAGLLYELSLIELVNNKQDIALKNLQKACTLEPDNWWYNTRLIGLYSSKKQYNEAIVLAEALKKKYPMKEASYNILIALYKETEKYEEAIGLYGELENITGINENITFEKLRLLLMANKFKKAVAEIDRLILKFPYQSKYKLIKGDILIQVNETDKAFEIYQQILKEDPESPFIYISLSEYYNKLGQPDKALEYIVLALKNPQVDVETKIEILGQHIERLLKSDAKIEDIESLFKMLIEYYPLEEAVHSYYASYLQYLKRDVDAAAVYESMIAINPKNAQTWLSLVQTYFVKHDYDRTIATCERALVSTEEKLSFYFYKGISQQLQENFTEAIKTYRVAVARFTDKDNKVVRSDIYAQLGDAYLKIEQLDSAFLAYDQAVNVNPDNIQALNNYAYYLSLGKKELSKAEKMSAKTVEKEPRNSTYLDTYAWVFYQQGMYSLAKFYIERAVDNLKEGQEQGVLLEHYGDILWMLRNNDQKALEVWKKAYDAGHQTEELKQKIDNNGWER